MIFHGATFFSVCWMMFPASDADAGFEMVCASFFDAIFLFIFIPAVLCALCEEEEIFFLYFLSTRECFECPAARLVLLSSLSTTKKDKHIITQKKILRIIGVRNKHTHAPVEFEKSVIIIVSV